MSLDLLIGLAGLVATALVVAGMILIAPGGAEPADRAPELALPGGEAPVDPGPNGRVAAPYPPERRGGPA